VWFVAVSELVPKLLNLRTQLVSARKQVPTFPFAKHKDREEPSCDWVQVLVHREEYLNQRHLCEGDKDFEVCWGLLFLAHEVQPRVVFSGPIYARKEFSMPLTGRVEGTEREGEGSKVVANSQKRNGRREIEHASSVVNSDS